MEKQNFKSSISLQIESMSELFLVQSERCFKEDVLLDIMSKEEYANIKKLIITGCGDSYTAGGVIAPILRDRIGVNECVVYDPMEFTRFLRKDDLVDNDSPEETLVLVISASGGTARIAEMLEKAKAAGVKNMLISNSTDSRASRVADMLYFLDTPPLANTPGFRSYGASLIAILSIGCMIGVANGTLEENSLSYWKQFIADYARHMTEEYIEEIDNQMFEVAQDWKLVNKVEFVGDASDFYSAQFLEETMIETNGLQSDHANSEDWCHVNFFMKNTDKIGTVFIANKFAPSYSRIIDSVKSAVGIGRKVLVVTNGSKEDFDEGADVCVMTTPDVAISELYSIVNYIPAAYLAEYMATLNDKMFFGRFDTKKQEWIEVEGAVNYGTTGSSEVKVII